MWRQVQVKIHWLFIHDRAKFVVVVDTDSKIKEVDRLGVRAKLPTKFTKVIQVALEIEPLRGINAWIRVMEPNTEAVVNVATIEQKAVSEAREKLQLMYTKVKDGIHASGRSTHGSTGLLMVDRVPKLKIVVAHNE